MWIAGWFANLVTLNMPAAWTPLTPIDIWACGDLLVYNYACPPPVAFRHALRMPHNWSPLIFEMLQLLLHHLSINNKRLCMCFHVDFRADAQKVFFPIWKIIDGFGAEQNKYYKFTWLSDSYALLCVCASWCHNFDEAWRALGAWAMLHRMYSQFFRSIWINFHFPWLPLILVGKSNSKTAHSTDRHEPRTTKLRSQ